jgi:tRNA(fMet)-specific endonuclease VapC
MFLLDSDIATLVYYGTNERVMARYDAARTTSPVLLSPITRAEILRGRLDSLIKAATSDEWLTAQTRLRLAEEWLGRFTVAVIDARATEHFERLVTNKRFKKHGRGDLLTACIALAHDATLVTRNTKDFQPIPNLKLANWAD